MLRVSLLAGLLAGCASGGSMGLEQRHLSAYVSRDGDGSRRVAELDAVVASVSRQLTPPSSGGLPAELAAALPGILERARERAHERAERLFSESHPEIPRTLERLGPADVELIWADGDIDTSHVMERASYSNSMDGPAEEEWVDHRRPFSARIDVAAARWPYPGLDDELPDIVVAHSSVAWSSPGQVGFNLAPALADELAAWVIERIERVAASMELVASTTPPKRAGS